MQLSTSNTIELTVLSFCYPVYTYSVLGGLGRGEGGSNHLFYVQRCLWRGHVCDDVFANQLFNLAVKIAQGTFINRHSPIFSIYFARQKHKLQIWQMLHSGTLLCHLLQDLKVFFRLICFLIKTILNFVFIIDSKGLYGLFIVFTDNF